MDPHGKTGSGAARSAGPNKESKLWLGWFVGHVAKGDREYVFVCRYTDRVPSHDDRPPGWIARDIAKEILARLGVY
jgi:beta-lactamase class D